MIVIIDTGAGNIASIKNMLKKVGIRSIISNSSEDIVKADKIILPGVGAFDSCMESLKRNNLIDILNDVVLVQKKPCLGICLGAQILGNSSEEGSEAGLGWIDMETVKFSESKCIKVPHVGWNYVKPNKEHSITDEIDEDCRFYFTHSYYMKPNKKDLTLLSTDYGGFFASAVQRENIVGVQFHPEKSHKFGMKLLKKFGEL